MSQRSDGWWLWFVVRKVGARSGHEEARQVRNRAGCGKWVAGGPSCESLSVGSQKSAFVVDVPLRPLHRLSDGDARNQMFIVIVIGTVDLPNG